MRHGSRGWEVQVGECRHLLSELPAKSVQLCVTSPPYHQLRSYGTAPQLWGVTDPDCQHQWAGGKLRDLTGGTNSSSGTGKTQPHATGRSYEICEKCGAYHGELGAEPTVELFCQHLVEVFAGVHRVLRDDGVLVVNISDTKTNGSESLVPPKFAAAMQAYGWLLRSSSIWMKGCSGDHRMGSVMPDSVSGTRWERCRVKVAQNQQKDSGYAAIDHRTTTKYRSGGSVGSLGGAEWADCPGCKKCKDTGGLVLKRNSWRPTNAYEMIYIFSKQPGYYSDYVGVLEPSNTGPELANPRNVLYFNPDPYSGQHFAAYTTHLPMWFIKAFTPEHGSCADCGAPYARVVKKERVATRPTDTPYKGGEECGANKDHGRHVRKIQTLGWMATCKCACSECVPAKVLDPFSGSGSTVRAARLLNRYGLGLELNPEYAKLSEEKIVTPLESKPAVKQVASLAGQKSLFG